MQRRVVVPPIGLALLLLMAGCLTPLGLSSGTETKPLPEPPDTVTNESAKAYAAQFELNDSWNRAVDGEFRPTGQQMSCDTWILDTTDDARLLYVWCTGGIMFDNGMHADAVESALHWVEDGRAWHAPGSPADTTDRQFTSDRRRDFASYSIYNLDDEAHDVTATLAHARNGTRLASFNYTIDGGHELTQSGIPYENTSTVYELTVKTEEDSLSFDWRPDRPNESAGRSELLYVTPDGTLGRVVFWRWGGPTSNEPGSSEE